MGSKPGYPQFKKKGKSTDSFYVANDKLSLSKKSARLPVIGHIKLRESLRFDGKIMGATVKRVADAWFLVVQVAVDELQKPRIADGVVGVDLGITTLATLSTGEKVTGPRALKSNLKRLKRISRWHSRKQKGSSNRKKSAMVLARLHRRVADIRNDGLHKLTTRLCRENKAVGIEALAVGNMVRNRKLARSINDAGWRELRRQLGYKAILYSSEVVVHDRFYPSSKMCSGCGNVKVTLGLHEREYVCDCCGLCIDRDENAALNLKPLPRATGEVTPVDRKALVDRRANETGLVEAGTYTDEHLRSLER